MKEINKFQNNIFQYATSELSQDAFIAWLLSYAYENAEKDIALNACAKDLLLKFLTFNDKDRIIFESGKITLKNIELQKFKIDVLVTVKYEDKIYKIIIEDKTFTKQHSGQLEKYEEKVREAYPDSIIKKIYFKTGPQCDLKPVEEAGYCTFNLVDIIKVLEKYYRKTDNKIFLSYYEYWKDKKDRFESYSVNPIEQWDWWAVYGFYDYLKVQLDEQKLKYWYGYVHNQNGGFHALSIWVPNDEDKILINGIKYSFYFHIATSMENSNEQGGVVKKQTIDWKIQIYNNSNYKEAREKFIKLLERKNLSFYIKKPKRYGTGVHITLGRIDVFDDKLKIENNNITFQKIKFEIDETIKVYKQILKKLKKE